MASHCQAKSFIKVVGYYCIRKCVRLVAVQNSTVKFQYILPTMSEVHRLVFLVIGVLLMLSLVVDAQPTVDDGGSCEFPALDETARDVKLMKQDLTEVKNVLGSRQLSALDSSSLCEYNYDTHSLIM